MRATNRGNRKWILPGAVLRPGESVTLSADSWRLALALNAALGHAVGTEIELEEEALPVHLPPVLLPEAEPEYIEPEAEQPAPVEIPAVAEPSRPERRRGRR